MAYCREMARAMLLNNFLCGQIIKVCLANNKNYFVDVDVIFYQ